MLDLFEMSAVRNDIPEKEGLRQCLPASKTVVVIVRNDIPEKEGLRPPSDTSNFTVLFQVRNDIPEKEGLRP